ncbi:alcohol dehydrogenase catalytic domain-containing protein [Williamsia sp. CHRR-6]|uniref:alcohol dehydrogenase catalytic domain-containing protein n=1 Tax=Williamsia sp. CHRR-6 TaxID=2835871 RepID=UPI001BDAC56A|nr:alcohol dehydrogenase catalytic domain-containing protein [Williamsia sp. CHRR-6]MBT0568656.1 alcohol dehydrogenase catalytic domain-containing protein [Williamsia sp. CHRR-6]
MRAVVYDDFGGPLSVRDVDPPVCAPHGVVVDVAATGLCRSDWHGWMGHDPDIPLPNVPGHELAGRVVEVGAQVRRWRVGQRVTVPFVCACGECEPCRRGDQQVCLRQTQPGFTHAGSFAERVALDHADVNLVELPDAVDFDTAAALGCRFATAYRAVVQVAAVSAGDRVAVHGCGGVGLSAVMIAVARGAVVIGVDPSAASREMALTVGAHTVCSTAEEVADMDVSIDAFGAAQTMRASLRCLRPRGRHIQVGLLGADSNPQVPMAEVVARELQVLGSHGMAAHTYPAMLAEIADGRLAPASLVREIITLAEVPARLADLGRPGAGAGGVTVIRP